MRKYLPLVVCLAVFCFGVLGIFYVVNNSERVICSGEETFVSESDYLDFKIFLLDNDDIEIKEVQTLSSDPPIWVKYTITKPRNMEFGYSIFAVDGDVSLSQVCLLSFFVAVGLLGFMATLPYCRS